MLMSQFRLTFFARFFARFVIDSRLQRLDGIFWRTALQEDSDDRAGFSDDRASEAEAEQGDASSQHQGHLEPHLALPCEQVGGRG